MAEVVNSEMTNAMVKVQSGLSKGINTLCDLRTAVAMDDYPQSDSIGDV